MSAGVKLLLAYSFGLGIPFVLAAVAIEDAELYRPLAAIYKKGKVLSPAMRQFINILKEGGAKPNQ